MEQDCKELAEYLETLTVSEDNHFTEYDVLCALKTYYHPSERAYRRNIDYISNSTGIRLERAKRNGSNQADHLEEIRAIRDIRMRRQGRKWTDGNGRPSAEGVVKAWQQEHPNGKKTDCIRDTGLSKPTVYKWW